MCNFCEGTEEKIIRNKNGIIAKAVIEQKKFLVFIEENKRYGYDLNYCPECGNKLSNESIKRVYVTNITKNKITYSGKTCTLHAITCDKGYSEGNFTEKQVGFIVTEEQLDLINKYGYCDIVCTASYEL